MEEVQYGSNNHLKSNKSPTVVSSEIQQNVTFKIKLNNNRNNYYHYIIDYYYFKNKQKKIFKKASKNKSNINL